MIQVYFYRYFLDQMGIAKRGRFSPFCTQCREGKSIKNLYKQKEIIDTEGKKYSTLEICL